MPTYQTPGVYTERIDTTGAAISIIRTDIAGFVGIAERGPLDTPVPVQSWRQFRAHFGGHTGAGFLAYVVQAFFENRGQRCWVVRVANRDPGTGAATAAATLDDISGAPAWRVAASSPGAWGDGLRVIVRETHRAQTRTDPARGGSPMVSPVTSTAGLTRGTLVRLSQPGRPPLWRVVSDVDAITGVVHWVSARPEARLPYDAPLAGLDLAAQVEIESVEYTLIVRAASGIAAVIEGLSLVPEHARYGPRVLAAPVITREPGGQATIPAAPPIVVIEELRPGFRPADRPLGAGARLTLTPLAVAALADAGRPLTGGADGLAALTAADFLGEPFDPTDSDPVRAGKRRGLRTLEEVDEVAILAVPDITVQPALPPATAPLPPCVPDPCLPNQPPPVAPPPPRRPAELPPVFTDEEVFRLQAAMIEQCERLRTRVALLDPPATAALDPRQAVAAIRAWRRRFDTSYAALTFPWLRALDPLRLGGALTRAIPPSGHVAGQYARTDLEVGVHQAPANAPLATAQDVTVAVDEPTHGLLNDQGVDVIRALPGRGVRILGARTLSSDSRWRFVNVRRLLLMIEQAIDRSIQWAVFEPNDQTTRAKLTLVLTSYLLTLWQQGALTGATMHEAFFVKCDEENNPPRERDLGRLIAEVGVAPSQPFEFIVIRVGRTRDEFEVIEDAASLAMGVS